MVENEILRDMAFYEALSVEELSDRYSDLELRHILQRVFNMDSTVYFMGKQAKLEFITDSAGRGRILGEAESKRGTHRERNRESAGRKSIEEMIEENTAGAMFRYIGVEKPQGGFSDAITQRRAQVAYVIEDVASGDRFQVTKGTVRALESKSRLEGFQKTFAQGRKSVAHEAGKTTLADRRVQKTPLDTSDVPAKSEVVDDLVDLDSLLVEEETTPEEETPEEETEPKSEGKVVLDTELDDILNSIPS